MFGHEPKLPALIRRGVMLVINMGDLNAWIQACEQQVTLFQRVMPMAMEHLATTQHQDTLCYATIRGGGYWPQI